MRKNEREGDPEEEKSISGVTEVLGKQLSKNIFNHPFTVMQPFVLQHTRTRTHTHKISSGRSYENYYFHIVDDRLEKII